MIFRKLTYFVAVLSIQTLSSASQVPCTSAKKCVYEVVCTGNPKEGHIKAGQSSFTPSKLVVKLDIEFDGSTGPEQNSAENTATYADSVCSANFGIAKATSHTFKHQ